jgi:GNAT superfamily N-acetyltransferase
VQLAYAVRPLLPSDTGFVARSWVDTARAGSRQARAMEAGAFNRWHYAAVAQLLASSSVEVRVAAPPEDDTTIYGFAVLEGTCLHCVYVRKAVRRLGIARALVDGVNLESATFSLWSQDVAEWVLEKYPGLRFAPLWLRQYPGDSDGKRGSEAGRAGSTV